MCGSQETVEELNSGIKIVYGYFKERGNSTLKLFHWLIAVRSVATPVDSLLANMLHIR